jgi:fibronectin type 3 domain-containing protein
MKMTILTLALLACLPIVFGVVYAQNADTGAKLEPPTQLTARPADGKVSLRWRPSPSYAEADYTVYQATNRAGAFRKIGVTQSTEFMVTNLVNGATYYFRVTASLNRSAESVPSNLIAGTPESKK